VTAAATGLSPGAALFARYAHAPNALGYCGPPGSALVDGSEARVRAAARQFSGAWPYLRVLARMTGIADPLDRRLVAAYWLGGSPGAELDGRAFGAALLGVLGPQAGHYWAHLTPDLLDEAAATHCFHVFGVYPWSRLLTGPMAEHPVHVLDSCRIRWGTVVRAAAGTVDVRTRRLSWDGHALAMAPPAVEQVTGVRLPVEPGQQVALHWDRLCDVLDPAAVEALAASTAWQLEVTNRRLAR
jgi:uncharacterized protein DUF6390